MAVTVADSRADIGMTAAVRTAIAMRRNLRCVPVRFSADLPGPFHSRTNPLSLMLALAAAGR
jgi:hypothetical protein